jgi:hypothetical protein
MYSRNGSEPWRKDSATGLAGLQHWIPVALLGEYAVADLKLIRRDTAIDF